MLDIAEGHYGDTRLDGVAFVTAAMVAGPMGDGNWTVGLIIDGSASDAQVRMPSAAFALATRAVRWR